jgi:fructokinase
LLFFSLGAKIRSKNGKESPQRLRGADVNFLAGKGAYAMTDLTAIGEILIDLTQTGRDARGIPQFAANPGGAPANVAVAARRLGATTAFVGKVGRDGYGRYLRGVLEENGVNTQGLVEDEAALTTLAVVTVDDSGERSFTFYRDNTADVRLSPEDVAVGDTKILHFGSVSLTAEPSRSATLSAVRSAKKQGALISYDPNYRANLWDDPNRAIGEMKAPLPLVDVLKVSDEELVLLTGTADLEVGSQLLAKEGIGLVLVTLGGDGAFFRLGELTGKVPGFSVQVADTNGAGDTFFGAILTKLAARGGLDGLTEEELRTMVTFANRAASLTTSRSGAIPAMPQLHEVTI